MDDAQGDSGAAQRWWLVKRARVGFGERVRGGSQVRDSGKKEGTWGREERKEKKRGRGNYFFLRNEQV